jgi:hypothetical protein
MYAYENLNLNDMPNEQWKQFAEGKMKNYFVSNFGRVKRITKVNGIEKIRKQQRSNMGYLQLRINGKWYIIHREVAKSFIPNPNNKPEVNHIVPIRLGGTNEVTNLEWVTRSENMKHAYKLKRKEMN